MAHEHWRNFEFEVATTFNLDLTLASGNHYFDQGDAVTRGRHKPFPLYADAKATRASSFSLKLRELQAYQRQAEETGRRLILPIRFEPLGLREPADYVLIGMHDLKELMDMAGVTDG